MILLIESLIGVALFTAFVVPSTAKDPLGWISDYPLAIRTRCEELGLVTPRKQRFTAADLIRKGIAVIVCGVVLAFALIRFNGVSGFWQGFRDAYILWLVIAWWDALVIDCGWFCHSKRVRIPGTEDMPEYHDYGFHLQQSCIGSALGLPVCLLVGLFVQLFA